MGSATGDIMSYMAGKSPPKPKPKPAPIPSMMGPEPGAIIGARKRRGTVAQALSLPASDAASPRASRPVASARWSAA